jgi:hypothetical protein
MKIIILIATLLLTSCTDPDGTRKALSREGYTDIELGGYSIWGCAKGDDFATKWKAKKAGQTVEGVFCSGWLKGGTIRTF